MEKRALGKGLEALITPAAVATSTATVLSHNTTGEHVYQLPINQIRTNKYQPRVDFNQEKLNELISSIREKGVIQPILVRKAADGYELIAGERRFRAAKALAFDKMPAIVKDVTDLDMLEISLIENIQREELNPIEEAVSFQRFITEFSFTQEKIAQVLGKDRSTIANTIRLLALPKKIQDYISKNTITMGHAKAILSISSEMDQLRVCNLVVKKGLSVRETESLVSRRSLGQKKIEIKKDQNIADIENQLQQLFGTRVVIAHGKKRGKIQIDYYSTEDFNRILDVLQGKPKQ